jgi:hypothetical protein
MNRPALALCSLLVAAVAWTGVSATTPVHDSTGPSEPSAAGSGSGGQKPEINPAAASLDGAPETEAAKKAGSPPPELEAFLGTWLFTETLTDEKWQEPVEVERYLLLRWRKGRLRVKTLDYYPGLRTRGMESDWNGNIRVDRWNVEKQTFTPMPDGTISMGLSGTNGVGPLAGTTSWWAAGRLRLEAGEEGPVLRFITTQGYAPSSKGNAWRPLDRTYRLLSREIDPRFAPENRR